MDVQSAASVMGKVGGPARAKALSPERRSEIAALGAAATNAKRARRKKVRETLRWKDGLCLIGMTVVGTIEEQFNGGKWFATACDVDWQDVNLGCHNTKGAAKAEVESWVRARM